MENFVARFEHRQLILCLLTQHDEEQLIMIQRTSSHERTQRTNICSSSTWIARKSDDDENSWKLMQIRRENFSHFRDWRFQWNAINPFVSLFVCEDFINFHRAINLPDLSMVKTCHWFRLKMFPGSQALQVSCEIKSRIFYGKIIFCRRHFFGNFFCPSSDQVDDLFAFENWYEFQREEEWKEFNYAMTVNN